MEDDLLVQELVEAARSDCYSDSRMFIERITKIKWISVPNTFICAKCGSSGIERSVSIFGGAWSGSVRCKMCSHRESLVHYMARRPISFMDE